MTKIYLIRHAEAEGNLYRRIQGHYNGKITPRGHEQVARLANRFEGVPIDAVYASDLTRTQTTAQSILKGRSLPLNIDPRLKEVGMGVWEDQLWGNAMYDDLQQMVYFGSDPAKWSVAGSEPYEALQARMFEVLSELGARHEGQTIACFSHGMAIRTLICKIKGLSSQEISQIPHGDNTCVAELSYENDELQVHSFNDNSHLPQKVSTFASQEWWKSGNAQDVSNLRMLPFDLAAEPSLYTDCYRDAWVTVHKTDKGFYPEPYRKSARQALARHPLALMKVFAGEDFAGVVELDTDRAKQQNAGWLSFCYLTPEFQNRGLGVQLVGHAVSVFRKLGRESLRLHVSVENERAIAFYERLGFEKIGTDEGIRAPLLLMEMAI